MSPSKTPEILLIQPPSNSVEDDRLEPPLGLLYVVSTLLEKNYGNVSLLDMTGCPTEQAIANKIVQIADADYYGISCFTTNYYYVKRIVSHIKERRSTAFVALGGPHPTGMPEVTYQDSGADVVVVGEGEDAFADAIAASLQRADPKGIIYGKGRANIDSYAFPARSVVDTATYSRRILGRPAFSLLSSRGCIHHCIHCNSVVMGGGSTGARYRTPDNVIEEIKTLRDECAYYRFNDDHFSGNPKLEELLLKLRDLDIKFRIFARVEDLDDRTCQLLKAAGCIHVAIGLESLNRDNLRVIGKKHQAGKETNVHIAKAHGLIVRASFMVGLPYDNDQTVLASFREAASLGLDEFAIYPLIPYPGTVVWQHPERFGYSITHTNFTDYVQMGKDGRTCYALRHKNFSPEDVMRWKDVGTDMLCQAGVKHMRASDIAR